MHYDDTPSVLTLAERCELAYLWSIMEPTDKQKERMKYLEDEIRTREPGIRTKALQYLKDVFGCEDEYEVGPLTWDVIKENADAGHSLDKTLLEMRPCNNLIKRFGKAEYCRLRHGHKGYCIGDQKITWVQLLDHGVKKSEKRFYTKSYEALPANIL